MSAETLQKLLKRAAVFRSEHGARAEARLFEAVLTNLHTAALRHEEVTATTIEDYLCTALNMEGYWP